MATLGANNLTLTEVARRTDPTGVSADIAEMLSETNEILTDIPWFEGNLATGERYTQRTGMPSVTRRKANQGVSNTASTTVQIDDDAARFEALSKVDEMVAETGGKTADIRLSEAQAHIEAMGQQVADDLFYGSSATTPEGFDGLAPRFNDLSAANADQIIDGAGSGSDNSSVWLIGWGRKSVYGFYPMGTRAGLERNDKGKELVTDSNGDEYYAYVDQFIWRCGLAVKDYRYVVRLANIDISDLVAGSGVSLINRMVHMTHILHETNGVRPVFYANRTVQAWLDDQALDKANAYLRMGEIDGKPVSMIRNIPIHRCDALTETEAEVT